MNRRESHRVEGEVLMRCQRALADDDAMDPVHERLRNRLYDLESDLQTSLLRLRREAPAVVNAFELLAAKVDVLADAVDAVVTTSSSTDLERRRVELSASGIAFDSKTGFEAGDNVQLSIVLLPQMEAVNTCGCVVRAERQRDAWRVSVQFENLSTDGERRLYRHVMNLDKQLLSNT